MCCSNVTFDFEKSIFFVLLLLFIFSTSYCCRLILASASSYLRELVEISDETVLLVPHVSRDTILNLRNLLYSGNTQKVYTGVKCKHRVQICNDGFHKTLYLKNRHQKGKSWRISWPKKGVIFSRGDTKHFTVLNSAWNQFFDPFPQRGSRIQLFSLHIITHYIYIFVPETLSLLLLPSSHLLRSIKTWSYLNSRYPRSC